MQQTERGQYFEQKNPYIERLLTQFNIHEHAKCHQTDFTCYSALIQLLFPNNSSYYSLMLAISADNTEDFSLRFHIFLAS